MPYDLVSLGEVMLRMSPPRFERLRRATRLDVQVAGSQLNVAANLARLGRRTAFISRLPANELGLLARDTCTGYGVDMSHVLMIAGARMGVNYLEFSAEPRVSVTVYDRQNSAASYLTVDDFEWDALLTDVRCAHTDGIFPGLSATCREATQIYLKTARQRGCLTTFDVNYREHLWTEATARACWETLLPFVDVVVTNRSVSEAVFGFTGTDEELMRQYHDAFGCRVVCLTSREMMGVLRGAWSSIALADGNVMRGKRFEFDVIDRFGTGDAFFAGFVYGYLERDVAFGLNFGDAACALAHTVEGDVAHFSAAEVVALLNDNYDLRVRR